MVCIHQTAFHPQPSPGLLRWPLVLGMQVLIVWPFLLNQTTLRLPMPIPPLLVSLITPTPELRPPVAPPAAPTRPVVDATPLRPVAAVTSPPAAMPLALPPTLAPAITLPAANERFERSDRPDLQASPAPPLAGQAPPQAAATASPAAPAPVMPLVRRQIAASAVHYRVWPPVEVPRASKRAGESGTVWLRVVVGTSGEPMQVSVQRSSGFARLDEQALWAMRQARFQPHTEDGRAVEVDVIAPIEYPAD